MAEGNATGQNEAVHGHGWAFGHSGAREDAIWKNGFSGSSIIKNKKSKRADTTSGIDRAIDQAEKSKGQLGLSVTDESGTWKVAPEEKQQQADETIFRDRRHVVRAFADVKPSDDLSISVGPELILKDDHKGEETANESQPDSMLGIGMKFKYDF